MRRSPFLVEKGRRLIGGRDASTTLKSMRIVLFAVLFLLTQRHIPWAKVATFRLTLLRISVMPVCGTPLPNEGYGQS